MEYLQERNRENVFFVRKVASVIQTVILILIVTSCDSNGIGGVPESKDTAHVYARPDSTILSRAQSVAEQYSEVDVSQVKIMYVETDLPLVKYKNDEEFFVYEEAIAVNMKSDAIVNIPTILRAFIESDDYINSFGLAALAMVDHRGRVAIGDTLYSILNGEINAEHIYNKATHKYMVEVNNDDGILDDDYVGIKKGVRDGYRLHGVNEHWEPFFGVEYYGIPRNGYIYMQNRTYTKTFPTRYLAEGKTEVKVCNNGNFDCDDNDNETFVANTSGFISVETEVELGTVIYNSCATIYYTTDVDSDTAVRVQRDRCANTGASSTHWGTIDGVTIGGGHFLQ